MRNVIVRRVRADSFYLKKRDAGLFFLVFVEDCKRERKREVGEGYLHL